MLFVNQLYRPSFHWVMSNTTHNLTITQFDIENLVLKKYIYSISICICSSKFSDVLKSWNLEKAVMEKQIKIILETLVTKCRNLEENGIYSQRAGVFEKKCRLICEEQNFIWSYFRWNRRNRRVLCAYQTE